MSRMRWLFMAVVLASSGAVATEQGHTSPGAWNSLWSLARSLFAQAPPDARPGPLAQGKSALPAPEEVAVPPPPRFHIERFDVQGNTLLSVEEIAGAVPA